MMSDRAKDAVNRLRGITLRVNLRLIRFSAVVGYRWATLRQNHYRAVELVFWCIPIAAGVLLSRQLQLFLAGILDPDGAKAVRGLLSTVGGAMIGATAITASFILFALQVNVQRLPHGLFRRFSSDPRLIASVAGSLLLAISGTALSLISDDRQVATAVLLGTLTLAMILRLLFYAYRRSLLLIDPAEQLGLIHAKLARGLKRWGRRVDALASIIELPDEAQRPLARENRYDTKRAVVLQQSPNWAHGVKVAIGQVSAYARRAGESGDLEVSAYALTTLVGLNATYIETKGRTFFANHLMFDNNLVSDGVVSETLEEIRRLRAVALARRDELQLEQLFNTLVALVRVYGSIEYGNAHDDKSHALLAAGYLESAVEAVLSSGLTDTVMRGVQAMGSAATFFVANARPLEAASLINKIAAIGSIGAVKADEKPVTLVAMEQLRDLTLGLICSEAHNPGYALRQTRQSVLSLTQIFLQTPDAMLGGHATYLAPYYSVTSQNALVSILAQMANALVEREAGDALAERIIDHIEEWADQIFDSQKAILILAAEKRSPFFFDIAHWIANVGEVLLVVAAAPAARDHSREELRKHAHWLISTLSWIPTDVETAKFVENWSYLDNLTRLAQRCRHLDAVECYENVEQMMLDWALKAGTHHTGWGTLGRWLLALAGLAMTDLDERAGVQLKTRLAAKLANAETPNQEMRDRAARDLREASGEVRDRQFEIDLVQRLLASGDRQKARQLLVELAAILSPETVNQPVRRRGLGMP